METAEIIAAINNQTIVTVVSILGITLAVGGVAIVWLRSGVLRINQKLRTRKFAVSYATYARS